LFEERFVSHKEINVKNSWLPVLACALITFSAAAQDRSANVDRSKVEGGVLVIEKGEMLIAANGARLGRVYRVGADGSVQMIIDGKMVTIPASTLSSVDNKLTTNLSKSEVLALR
jgi:hypothetical protein